MVPACHCSASVGDIRVYGAVPGAVRPAEGFWAHTEPPGLESQNVHRDFHKNVHLDFQFSPLKQWKQMGICWEHGRDGSWGAVCSLVLLLQWERRKLH